MTSAKIDMEMEESFKFQVCLPGVFLVGVEIEPFLMIGAPLGPRTFYLFLYS
jgi:hypothetical protein